MCRRIRFEQLVRDRSLAKNASPVFFAHHAFKCKPQFIQLWIGLE
jgi:hypothetical protein